MPRPAGDAGFTLIEMIVALALFALISLAGVSLIDTVMNIQRHTGDRLERIAQLQRAMYLMTADFEQLDSVIALAGSTVTFGRNGAGADRRIAYRFEGGALDRSVDGVSHILVPNVASLGWEFHLPGRGWQALPAIPDDPTRPDAIALTLRLDDRAIAPGGTLRRVVSLPEVP